MDCQVRIAPRFSFIPGYFILGPPCAKEGVRESQPSPNCPSKGHMRGEPKLECPLLVEVYQNGFTLRDYAEKGDGISVYCDLEWQRIFKR